MNLEELQFQLAVSLALGAGVLVKCRQGHDDIGIYSSGEDAEKAYEFAETQFPKDLVLRETFGNTNNLKEKIKKAVNHYPTRNCPVCKKEK